MKRIYWEKGITELTIFQSAVSIAIVSAHIELDIFVGESEVKDGWLEPGFELIVGDPASIVDVEDAKRVN